MKFRLTRNQRLFAEGKPKRGVHGLAYGWYYFRCEVCNKKHKRPSGNEDNKWQENHIIEHWLEDEIHDIDLKMYFIRWEKWRFLLGD